MTDELLLGEVTDEVRAFLEGLGRKVPDKPHVYLGPPARTKLVSRHVEHDPPHYRFLGRPVMARLPIELRIELGDRVENALRMQANTSLWLSTLPVYLEKQPDE